MQHCKMCVQGEGRLHPCAATALGWFVETGSCMWMSKNALLAYLWERVGPRAAVGLPRNLDIPGGNVRREGLCVTGLCVCTHAHA
jgi:hypothetical protein